MSTDDRIKRLNTAMLSTELDAYLALTTSDIRWLTGFSKVFDEEKAHALLVTSTRLKADPQRLLHTDMRYSGSIRPQSSGVLEVLDDERKPHSQFLVEQLEALLAKASTHTETLRIGVEAEMPLNAYRALDKSLADAGFSAYELVELPGFIQNLRAIKDPEEIASIKAAQSITDAGFLHLLEYIKPGLSEFEVAVELEFYLRRMGSEGVAFGAIVGSGPNGANPHAVPGDRQIQRGDLIVLDFGAKLDDYRSDMTRTVAVGPASERQRQIYGTVLQAQLTALEMMKAGLACVKPFDRVNEIFAEQGFGNLEHGLGHGVGIDIHEAPVLASKAEGDLAVGHVVTVEPGIYIAGYAGVRIEDFGAVTAEGFDNFTASTKELIEI